MTLETLYYVTQIVAVVLIFPTLVFLPIQNRQSQKQMERANEIARAEYSGKIMDMHKELVLRMADNAELGRAFRQLTIENKRIEDVDMLTRLMTWFTCYSSLYLDTLAAHEKGLVDEDVVNLISGSQAFHLSFPVVWDSQARIFAQRELDAEKFEAIMSRMVALRNKAQTRQWADASKYTKQGKESETSADTTSEIDEESGA